MSRSTGEYGSTPGSISTTGAFQHIISRCLELLNPYSAGTAIYILSCLCPEDLAVVLELMHLDLSRPHQHARLSKNDVRIKPHSYESLLSRLRVYTNKVAIQDYRRFWLELTGSWLLTCPRDSNDYQNDEAGEDSFCQKLRNQLIDSILCID